MVLCTMPSGPTFLLTRDPPVPHSPLPDPPAPLPQHIHRLIGRRSFIRWGLGGIILLGAVGCLPESAPPSPGGLPPTWDALSRRICAGDDPLAQDPLAIGTPRAIAQALSDLPADLQRQLVWAVRALDWSGIAYAGDFFHRLPPEKQDRVLTHWMDSRFTLQRTVFRALKELCMMAYYGAPETWDALGYDGPWS